jgi:pimeloyl-ACP methyl ester carboxylesterase
VVGGTGCGLAAAVTPTIRRFTTCYRRSFAPTPSASEIPPTMPSPRLVGAWKDERVDGWRTVKDCSTRCSVPSPIEDPVARERFSNKWTRVLGATYGGRPDVDDIRIMLEPWGFDLDDTQVPVHAWHGDNDENVPLGLIQHAMAKLPISELTVCPGEGHFLSPIHHQDILKFLLADR